MSWFQSLLGRSTSKAINKATGGGSSSAASMYFNSLVPGLGTGVSSAFGYGSSDDDMSKAQHEANKVNLGIANKNRDWQEWMSSTAHQREVADLRLAGLNPVLSATLGGSSTPVGAMTNVQPEYSPEIAKVSKFLPIQMALDVAKTIADIANTNSATSVNKKVAHLKDQESDINESEVSMSKNTKRVRDSWYGRNVLPWLDSTASAIGKVFSGSKKF